MTKKATTKLPEFTVLVGTCLGFTAYRGYAPLCDLARVSRADIFDQEKNQTGTQRNLSKDHAIDAYNYVSGQPDAFFPEIILNIRNKAYVKLALRPEGASKVGRLSFTKNPELAKQVVVSRLDGNHRLWYADGHEKSREPITRPVSFCFLMLANINEELEVFQAINDNQKGMNTSHLQNIKVRLEGVEKIKAEDPALYIAQKLQDDATSPLAGRVHQGGAIKKGATLTGLNTANLKGAVHDLLTRSATITNLSNVDAQYEVVKNYWIALQNFLPKAWKKPGDYSIFRGVGLYMVTYLGREIIDRCITKGKYEPKDMLGYLKALPPHSAFLSSGIGQYAGRKGGKALAAELIRHLAKDGEISYETLQMKILGTGK
ncbi:MAG: DGQHR domain-containing protein [Candidatus Sumerlaeaceae bacterium]